jgi:hypothetical protein
LQKKKTLKVVVAVALGMPEKDGVTELFLPMNLQK